MMSMTARRLNVLKRGSELLWLYYCIVCNMYTGNTGNSLSAPVSNN